MKTPKEALISVGASAVTPIVSALPCKEDAKSVTLSKVKKKLGWYELTFDDSEDEWQTDAMSPPSMSPPSTPRQACASGDTDFIDEAIEFATLSVAPDVDNSEDHSPYDLHPFEDSSRSVIGTTMELSSVGSAMHRLGTCVPCKFINRKSGCDKGRRCKCCHLSHEQATRKTKARRRLKHKVDEFEGSVTTEASTSDTLSSLQTPLRSRNVSEGTADVSVDADRSAVLIVDKPIQLATLAVAPVAAKSADRAPLELCAVEAHKGSCIGSTTELLSVGSAMHRAGTCVPCKFMNRKSGCSQGRKCKSCHYTHEEATRTSKGSRQRAANKDYASATRALWSIPMFE
eukprot:TRINITY_DN12887_c0_g1_i2.p1 TRINITY_DN12887_c0_g1~~TRINITY_DN12887_c0_g1_i2.p1  ORF type:complete len:374 (+),score=39.91 TRINITY_DN12887_c0_g1_i2:92-1123(+)